MKRELELQSQQYKNLDLLQYEEDKKQLKEEIRLKGEALIEMCENYDRLKKQNEEQCKIISSYVEREDFFSEQLSPLQTKIETIVKNRDEVESKLLNTIDDKSNQINALLSVVTQQHYLIKELESQNQNSRTQIT